jgi:hypothetical protein
LYDTDKNRIQIKKNGTALTGKTGTGDPAEAGKFTFDKSNGKITLNEAPKAGDVFTITVKAGDAEAETITVRVGGPVLSSAAQTIEYGETYTRLPDFIGPATTTPTYSWVSSATGIATVAGGEVTTVAPGSSNISVTLTAPTTPADGWVYDTSAKTYPVTVEQATGTISFETLLYEETGREITAGDLYTQVAKLKNSKGTPLTATADEGGTIAYTWTATASTLDDSHSSFSVSSAGAVTVASTLAYNTTYTIEVTATVTPPTVTPPATLANATYSETTAKYTIKVTTKPEP